MSATQSAIPSEIQRDLEFMTRRWHELDQPVKFEIRALAEGKSPQWFRFNPDAAGIADAVKLITEMNGNRNFYVVRNPIRADVPASRAATDDDIVAAFFFWADCDNKPSAENVKRFDGPKFTAHIVTGRIPETRVHPYWDLDKPLYDMAIFRDMQQRIAQHFGSDGAVINPSRIMRVAGSVTHPDSKKRDRGYVSEVTTLRTEYPDTRPPVTLDQMQRVFGEVVVGDRAAPRDPATANNLQIDTGPQPLDRELMAIKALSGKEWHDAIVRLTGSYVSKGLTDPEIHALTDGLTLAGYTVEQTRREVQTAINGARRKGWTPEPPPTPNFDHAPAAEAGPWKIQNAADFTADFVAPEYIIDGIIQRGRLYTFTAPTGSGKTAVMLHIASAIASGTMVHDRETEQGDVLFLAGENPDDVRARVIATMETMNTDTSRLHFIPGTFSIRADLDRLRAEAEKLPNLVLIVVDTFAAYFDGEDENSNAQALDFARIVRSLTMMKSKSAVVMPAHPVKGATKGNLAPKGGSSLVNEVDGNLTLWNEDNIASLHWQVKFRGPEFSPVPFELERYESDSIKDSKGRLMPTILAKPLSLSRAMELAQASMSLEDRLLLNVEAHPNMSFDGRGQLCGGAHKQTVKRTLEKMKTGKLVKQFRTRWELAKDGERAVDMIRDDLNAFVPRDV